MNGRIWVESELGKGSTFFFTAILEVRPESEAEPQPDVSALKDLPVLVVDDNATNRKFMSEVLRKWGTRVTLADSAGQGLEILNRAIDSNESFRLVITDLHMPDMDGFQFSQKIRETPALNDTEIIMLTSGARTDDTDLCRKWRIVRHLLKPVKQSELLGAILFATDNRRKVPDQTSAPESFDLIGPQKILLAEDLVTNQKLAVALLKRWGHDVSVANNGIEAVAALAREDFDVVLMDVQMPEMDGLEATRAIRLQETKTGRHTPIIAMTAHAMSGDMEICLEAGMDGYLSKPVRKRELYEALLKIFGIEFETGELNAVKNLNKSLARGINWEEALQAVDGNRDLLRDIATTAQQELAQHIVELTDAVRHRNPDDIQRISHKLQGTIRIFNNEQVCQQLYEFEGRGRENRLDNIDDSLRHLRSSLDRIMRDLIQFQKES
jgi:CheY-like chemotaxis protein